MVSVIASIVLYKHSYLDLKPTLDSLLATPSLSKVILVDNDESTWAKSFSHSKVVYVKSEGNFGFGYGHNYAIKRFAQDADFFLVCNPDISFDMRQFEQLIEFAASRPEGLFLPRIVYANGENQYGARLLPSPLNLFARRFSPKYAETLDHSFLLKDFNLSKAIFAPYLHGCFMLFRSEALIALGGFDERFFMYMEDVDISRRCADNFGNVYYPFVQVVHAHEQGSYKNPILLKAHLKSAWQYFWKWGWCYDSGRRRMNSRCFEQLK